MRANFDFSEATELMKALDHYKKVLIRSLPYLDSSYKESLNSIWKEGGKYEGNYYESPVIKHWDEIDIHIVSQMWGSTSKGWSGMGGAAMTSDYNYIIHQKYTDLYYVYWDGKLAYIVKASEISRLDNLPGLYSEDSSRNKNITFLYKNHKKS